MADSQLHNESESRKQDELTLKWGTLKGWHFRTPEAKEAAQVYSDLGMSASAMGQSYSIAHTDALCKIIEVANLEYVWNDWDGEKMSKEDAIKYVREYAEDRRPSEATPNE